MKLSNRKFIIQLAIAFIVSLSFVGCKNADNKIEDASDKVRSEVENVDKATKKMASDAKKLAEKLAINSEVYNLTQVDMPPLMNKECENKKNPKECSDKKVMKFIKDNIEIPKKWNNEASLEQVLVVVEKDGSLRDIKYVASSNNKGCEECQKAAVDVVGKMTNWVPAMKDGKPVAVKLTIPVKFI